MYTDNMNLQDEVANIMSQWRELNSVVDRGTSLATVENILDKNDELAQAAHDASIRRAIVRYDVQEYQRLLVDSTLEELGGFRTRVQSNIASKELSPKTKDMFQASADLIDRCMYARETHDEMALQALVDEFQAVVDAFSIYVASQEDVFAAVIRRESEEPDDQEDTAE